MRTKDRDAVVDTHREVSIEPRNFDLGDRWFDPGLDFDVREKLVALLLRGQLPDWRPEIPPELRISRKLAFRIEKKIVVVAGIGVVKRDKDRVIVSRPQVDQRAAEGTVIHDSFIAQLDMKRDPLGGLSKRTLRLALSRMEAAHRAAGGLGIIPHVLAHGSLWTRGRSEIGFLVYSYPACVDRPIAWPGDSDGFRQGIENMARFLAALHRHLFHGYLFRPAQGFANTLWTTCGRVIPVITGWGQHAGLVNSSLIAQDVRNLIEAGIYQFHLQGLPNRQELSKKLARTVLTTYVQMRATFKEQDYNFQCDPVEDWQGSLDALTGDAGLVSQFIARN